MGAKELEKRERETRSAGFLLLLRSLTIFDHAQFKEREREEKVFAINIPDT